MLDTLPVTKLTLTPNSLIHRVRARNLLVGVSEDNSTYNMVDDWKVVSGEKGVLEIVFDNPKPARYIKIKCLFDNRTDEFAPVDMATFINAPGEIIKVHYLVTSRQESYAYDAIGNRKTETITQRYPITRSYDYYLNSSRLKTNGKYNFEYDNNGNLVKKTAIDGSVTWKYQYDLLNRLLKVSKNGTDIASYIYDESGLRLKKQGVGKTVYYVFDTGGNVLYEQENKDYLEYVYVLGKHFARVDGNLDNLNDRTKYFYHNDHLGSTVAVTDKAGQTVWASEYTPFGGKHSTEGELAHAAKFTGKDLDEDTGLYYFNARWYDQEVGRFISEDPANDPNSPNLYAFCANNPLVFVDPTGREYENLNSAGKWLYDINAQINDWLWSPDRWWNKSKGYDLNELLYKREIGEYYLQWERQTASYFSTGEMFGVIPLEEYTRLIASKVIDSKEYSFEQFVNDMGPIWEAKYNSRTPASLATDLTNYVFMLLTATEGINMLKSAAVYMEIQNKGTLGKAFEAAFVENVDDVARVTVYRVEGIANTRIIIGQNGQVMVQGKNTLFLNFGSEERATEFLTKRLGQGMTDAQIKSFQVPQSFLDYLISSAVPESMAKQFPNSPIVVDVTKAANQFGLRGDWLNRLQQAIIQGSGQYK